jgi:hypothetical protein
MGELRTRTTKDLISTFFDKRSAIIELTGSPQTMTYWTLIPCKRDQVDELQEQIKSLGEFQEKGFLKILAFPENISELIADVKEGGMLRNFRLDPKYNQTDELTEYLIAYPHRSKKSQWKFTALS